MFYVTTDGRTAIGPMSQAVAEQVVAAFVAAGVPANLYNPADFEADYYGFQAEADEEHACKLAWVEGGGNLGDS